MPETRLVKVCAVCQVHWYADGERPMCSHADHEHQTFEVHRHLTVVVLPDGTEVTAASFDPADPYARVQPPDFGVYLDQRWHPPWIHEHLDWPDFGVPEDVAGLLAVLSTARDRARRGDRVEVGCLGGHGRTGTALALLALLGGYPPSDAVAWVRANYCTQAVETAEQEAFVAGLTV
jgi:hypothetical protein